MHRPTGNSELRNLVQNGRFYGNLDEWTGTATIDRSTGYPRNGCAKIEDGQSIAQDAGLSNDSLYSLHYFYRLAPGATLTAGYGSITQAHTGEQVGLWHEGLLQFAVDASASSNVSFSSSGGTAYADAVTLRIGAIPTTRCDIARVVANRLGTLATDQSLSICTSAKGVNGDYTDAIDEALRATGAVGNYGEPDVTKVCLDELNTVIDSAYAAMLQMLQGSYALSSGKQTWLGPRKETAGNTVEHISMLLGGSGGRSGSGGGGRGRGAQETLHRSNGWRR